MIQTSSPPRAIHGVLVLAALSVFPLDIAAQDSLRPPPVPTCPGCRVEVRRIALLGAGSDADVLTSDPIAVARDGTGRFVVATPFGSGPRLHAFDSNGKYLKSFGPEGEGPGELISVRVLLFSRGDTLHVYDEQTGRHSIFDPGLRFVRSHTSPRALSDATVLPGGSTVVSAALPDPGRVGLLYHLFHSNGNYLGSFGDSSFVQDHRRLTASIRKLAPSHSGGFWSAAWTYRYRIEWWSHGRQLLRVIEPDSDWFPPQSEVQGGTPDNPPSPSLWGVWEDELGHLWTSGSAAAEDYARGLGPKAMSEGGEIYPTADPQRVWDGMIEVYDPVRGGLVARTRTADPYHFVVSPGLLAGVRWDSDGRSSIEVVAVVLRRPPL